MANKSRKPGDKFPSTISNYSSHLKLIFILLLLFTSIATLLLFLPNTFFPFSTTLNLTPCPTTTTTKTTPSPPQQPTDKIIQDGVVTRSFFPVGTAAYNFVFMSAYRGGPTTFAIMGLSSKPLHNFGNPTYTCEYQNNNGVNYKVKGKKLDFQDFGYARVYLVIVINCTFSNGVNNPSIGGRLLLHASTNGGYDKFVNSTDTIVALIEPPNSWEQSQFLSPPKYDFLYCGGSLFGDLSPQRIREWIAYHVRLFGKRSHFVIHDAGGVHSEVMEVLKPWMELGYVSVEDIREQERFDGFYHNQMVVLNDCLHRYRFDTKWMFFFDVDEYIYLGEKKVSIEGLMESVKDYTMVIIPQVSMSNQLCLAQDSPHFSRKWGFEKLVYKNGKKGRKDSKYAIQPRNVYATGVHKSENFDGKSKKLSDDIIKYYHFHGTVGERREPCRQLLKGTSTTMERTPYVIDTTLRSLAPLVKQFELDTIGSRLQSTKL